MAEDNKDAYYYSTELKDSLMKEGSVIAISKEFASLTCNADRVRFNFELMQERNLLPPAESLKCEKNEERSIAARNRGNQFFAKEKNYLLALEAYNESLCLAPIESESLAIAYANRSAIYLNAGFYGFCFENIALALANNYPERLRPKLLQRRDDCLNFMNNERDAIESAVYYDKVPELTYPSNPKRPFAIEGLEYASSNQFGRFVVAKHDLKPGDVIVVEKPFNKNLLKSAVYTNCTNCGTNQFYNLKPCPHSTMAMFCSSKCLEEAWQRFYQYEKDIIEGIFNLFTKICISAIRATIRAFTMVESPAELKDLVESIDTDTENAFTLDYSQENERQAFRAIYSLATNEADRNVANMFQRSSLCAIAWYMLREFSDFEQFLQYKEHEDIFLELLMRFNQAAAVNYHTLCEGLRKKADTEGQTAPFSPDYGSGSFALSSLINHSCMPNITRYSIAGTNVMIVIRPIAAGDQIFDNYG